MTDERRRLHIPDRRRNTYDQLETHLDDRLDQIERYIHAWVRGGLIAFGIIAIFCVLGLVGYGFLLREVQSQRHEVCTNQNTRHNRTIELFRAAAAKAIAQHPEQTKDIRGNIETNLRIINALAPKQNCDKVAPLGDLFP